jgi:hypothetical protein
MLTGRLGRFPPCLRIIMQNPYQADEKNRRFFSGILFLSKKGTGFGFHPFMAAANANKRFLPRLSGFLGIKPSL